jgi:Sec-independent protein secretion pathway component TatC
MAIPMYLRYEGGIIMARVLSGMRRPDEDDEKKDENEKK